MNKNLSKQHISMYFSLYITQYLGFAFFTNAFIGILRHNGMPLENLGFIFMLGLFWVIRFLWAPFIDVLSFGKKIGHYKGWIIIFQSLMILTLLFESRYSIINDLETIIFLSILFSFFSASQDVALDALVLKGISKNNRPFANALKVSGGLVGMILGGGGGLIMYSHFGWEFSLMTLAFITFFALLQICFYKESINILRQNKLNIDFKQYINFWKKERRIFWLLFLIIYPIIINVSFALLTPILVDLQWSLDKIGIYLHVIGYGIGVISSFFASWVINSIGKKPVLILAAYGQMISILLLLLPIYGFNQDFILILIIGVIFCFNTPSMVVITTLMMDEADINNPASQFAIQHSIFMFFGILFSGISISLAGLYGYEDIVFYFSLVSIITIYMSYKIKLDRA